MSLSGLAAICCVAAVGAPASAAVIIDDTTINGVTLDFDGIGPFADKVKNNGAPSGTTITLKTDSNRLVDYIGTGLGEGGVLQASGSGDGFAHVTGSNGYIGSLVIDPQGSPGFTAIDFNLGVLNEGSGFHYGDISLFLEGSVNPVVFDNVRLAQNQNKFSVLGAPGIVFTSIKFSGVEFQGKKANFWVGSKTESMRQVSMQFAAASAVPEPSTWAMMVIGMGAVGARLRSRGRKALAAA